MWAGAEGPRIVVIDHYDSFTHNIVHALSGARCLVVACDAASVDELVALSPDGFVLSAGPCTPAQAGVSVPLVQALDRRSPPLLGICLGHQAIACAFGGSLRRARRALHGRTVAVRHHGDGLFRGMPNPLRVARYNSLVTDTLPGALEATAWDEDGEVMALRHRALDLEGVQFHPESWLSEACSTLLSGWLERCRRGCAGRVARAG